MGRAGSHFLNCEGSPSIFMPTASCRSSFRIRASSASCIFIKSPIIPFIMFGGPPSGGPAGRWTSPDPGVCVMAIDERVVRDVEARSGAPGVLCNPDDCSRNRSMSNPWSSSSSLLSPSLISSSKAPRDPVLASTLDRVRAAGESSAPGCRAADEREVDARLDAAGGCSGNGKSVSSSKTSSMDGIAERWIRCEQTLASSLVQS